MLKVKQIVSAIFIITLVVQLILVPGCRRGSDESSKESSSDPEYSDIIPTVYPEDAVRTIEELGMKEGDYIRKDRGSYSWQGNSGHEEPTIVVSPYYALKLNGQEVPVYSTVTYVGKDGECALHSYSIVETELGKTGAIDTVLTSLRYEISNAVVLPESNSVIPQISGEKISAEITKYGDYTFLMNDDESEISQYNSFTLFVRQYRDEEAEIEEYINEYGEENVKIYESGTHYFKYINIDEDNTVLYLKRGSLLIPEGDPDYSEENQYTELGAKESNGWGLDRFPIITANGRNNVVITGGGTIDAGQLGWHERRGVMATFCDGVEISGITLVNFPEWTITTYVSSNINISDIRVFGYKTNSDGIAICNSTDAVVSGCFARSGDDLFEVKTLGAQANAVSRNILFDDCTAWAGKARCFGVIAEVSKDISDVTFNDCAVIIRDSIWDNNILGSLVVISSVGNGNVSDIVFKNIEIFRDYGRAINLAITDKEISEKSIQNIVFKNIRYSSEMLNNIRTLDRGDNVIEAVFDNVRSDGVLLDAANLDDHFDYDDQSVIIFGDDDKPDDSSDISSLVNSDSINSSSIVSESSSQYSSEEKQKVSITSVSFPADRVKTLDKLGFDENAYKNKAAQQASYEGNKGWDVSSIIISPYYTLELNDETIPVYASPVYVGKTDSGALQSFAMIDIPDGAFELDVDLSAKGISFSDAIVLPESLGIDTSVVPDKSIKSKISQFGIYNFLVTGSDGVASQQYAFVLIVRKYVDEEAEIASYKNQYGEDNVVVYEAGIHYIDYINVEKSNMVYYLRRGSLLVMNHKLDIDSDEDNQNKAEDGALASTGWGLNRFPVMAVKNKNNIKIVGRGTIDGGQLDWHERRGLHFSSCEDVLIEGINIINFPEWGIISYICNDVRIKNVMLLGWKTNSDAFALCNTTNSSVEMCFARTGDDMFEVKTLGGPAGAITDNILFKDCYAWGSKARCFGVTGEVEKNISNVVFRDCATIYRDAIWDNDRLGSLVIIVEVGEGNISDIIFENIEIYHDYGRAINTTIKNTDSPTNNVTNVLFKDITYKSDMKSQIRTRVPGTNSIEVIFDNVISNGYLLTESNYPAAVVISGENSNILVEN